MSSNERRHEKNGYYAPNTIWTPDGYMTRKQAAAHYNLNINTLHGRIHQGWPQEKLFVPSMASKNRVPKRGPLPGYVAPTFITAWGLETIRQAADRMGMTPTGLYVRVFGRDCSRNARKRMNSKPWPMEEAFNTPGHGIRGRHFILPPEEYRRRVKEHEAK